MQQELISFSLEVGRQLQGNEFSTLFITHVSAFATFGWLLLYSIALLCVQCLFSCKLTEVSVHSRCKVAKLIKIRPEAHGIYFYKVSHAFHILVFHLLTTLHKSDPHCHHHLCHHQSLLLFFTIDLKHTSSLSLFHRRLHHRYSLDWSMDSWPDRFYLLIDFVSVFSSRLSEVD